MGFNAFKQNEHGDLYLDNINQNAFNQLGSTGFYQQYFADQFAREDQLYIIIGSDSGLLPRYLSQHQANNNSRYLVIEPADVLATIQQRPDYQQLKQHVTFTDPLHWHESAENMDLWSYLATQDVSVLSSVGALDDHLGIYQALVKQVETTINQEGWHARVHFAGHTFTTIQLKNTAENHTPANLLKDIASNKRGLLLAGGPSLDSVLEDVKAHRDKLFVVAVSRISARLLEVGITPDIIVCIDPTEKMYTVSRQALQFEPVPILVQSYCATHLLTGVWPGKKLYLGHRLPWQHELNEENIQVVGPTVTNTALHVMLEMGFSTIYMAGLDLSYSIDGFTHAKGSAEFNAGPKLDFIGQKVELNDGSLGETDNAFAQAIMTLADQAQMAAERRCRLINLSPKAAKVTGIEYQPISTAIYNETIEDIHNNLQHALAQHYCHDSKSYMLKMLKSLKHTKRNLFQFAQLVKQGLQLCQQYQKNPQAAIASKLNKMDEKINQDRFKVLATVKMHGYRYLEAVFKFAASQTQQKDSMKVTQAYLKGYYKSANELMAMIDDAVERMEVRHRAYGDNMDYQALAKQWQKDRHYFKAYQVLKEVKGLSEQDQQVLQPLADKALSFEPKAAIPRTQTWDNLLYRKAVARKLEHLFKLQDTTCLTNTLSHLKPIKHPQAQAMQYFAQGLLAELRQDYTSAVEAYHAAASDELMEIALNHLVVVLIQKRDLNNAIIALECLSQLSPHYQSQIDELKKVMA